MKSQVVSALPRPFFHVLATKKRKEKYRVRTYNIYEFASICDLFSTAIIRIMMIYFRLAAQRISYCCTEQRRTGLRICICCRPIHPPTHILPTFEGSTSVYPTSPRRAAPYRVLLPRGSNPRDSSAVDRASEKMSLRSLAPPFRERHTYVRTYGCYCCVWFRWRTVGTSGGRKRVRHLESTADVREAKAAR